MTLAFIVNNLKTVLFFEIGKGLQEQGHKVLWISPGFPRWINWLTDRGVKRDDILDLSSAAEQADGSVLSDSDENELAELDAIEGFRINAVIRSDRLLRLRDAAFANRYLLNVSRSASDFLRDRKVAMIFAEPTWAFELMIAKTAAGMGVPLLAPDLVRIPDGRFAFFKGYLEERIHPVRAAGSRHEAEAEKFLKDFRNRPPKPGYYYLNQTLPAVQGDWIGKALRNWRARRGRARFDMTHFPLWHLVSHRLSWVRNARFLNRRRPFAEPRSDRPFVLYALHYQPESSIDIYSPFFSNQSELILNISRSLPSTHRLYVKEHSNAIGNRGRAFFDEVGSFPGVDLIDPSADSFSLMRQADCVLTVSGTIAYEAALLGRPGIVFSDMFFNSLPLVYRCRDIEGLGGMISDAIRQKNSMGDGGLAGRPGEIDRENIRFLAEIIANSWPGTVSDPRSDPSCTAPENIRNLVRGFSELLAADQA